MELICGKPWEVQLEKSTVAVTYLYLLCLCFPCFPLETHLNFLLENHLTSFLVYIVCNEDLTPDLGESL